MVSWSFRSLGSSPLYKRGDSGSFPRIGDLTYSYPPNGVLQLLPINGFNAKSLSLMHLVIAHTSHLVFVIQGDP